MCLWPWYKVTWFEVRNKTLHISIVCLRPIFSTFYIETILAVFSLQQLPTLRFKKIVWFQRFCCPNKLIPPKKTQHVYLRALQHTNTRSHTTSESFLLMQMWTTSYFSKNQVDISAFWSPKTPIFRDFFASKLSTFF